MTGIERRISHQLVHYWQRIKGDRIIPSESDIDSDELGGMWEDCFLIHLHESAATEDAAFANYWHLGANLQPVFLEGGQSEVSYLLSLPPEKLRSSLNEMQMTKLPIVESVEAFPVRGGVIKYRQCLVPLGDERGEIHSIFGGMRFTYA